MPGSAVSRIATWPCSTLWCAALSTRFATARASRAGSPGTVTSARCTSQVSSSSGVRVWSTASATRARRSTGRGGPVASPDCARASTSSPSIVRAARRLCSSAVVAAARRSSASASGSASATSSAARWLARGVRSSWRHRGHESALRGHRALHPAQQLVERVGQRAQLVARAAQGDAFVEGVRGDAPCPGGDGVDGSEEPARDDPADADGHRRDEGQREPRALGELRRLVRGRT